MTSLPRAANSGVLGENLWILVWLPVEGLRGSLSGGCAAEFPGMCGSCSGCSTHFPAQIHLNNTSLLKSKPPHLKSKNRNVTKLIRMNSYLQQIERETSHILCLNTVYSSLQRNYGTSQPFHHQKKPQKDKKNSNMKFKPQNKFSIHSLGKKPLNSWTS